MEYRIIQYPGGYRITRYNAETMIEEVVGETDSLQVANDYKAALEKNDAKSDRGL